MDFKKTEEKTDGDYWFWCRYDFYAKVDVLRFIKTLEALGYKVGKIGVGSNADMYEESELSFDIPLDVFKQNYEHLLRLEEFDGVVEIPISINNEPVHINMDIDRSSLTINGLAVTSYAGRIYLEDILKKECKV